MLAATAVVLLVAAAAPAAPDRSSFVFRAVTRRPCYGAEIGNHDDPSPAPGVLRPRHGQRMRVVVRLGGRAVARATARARHVGGHEGGFDQANRRYLRRLGCGR
jgi:hypothetical protein